MSSHLVAVKCYGYAWMLEYGLTEREAATRLREHGVDWALLQNRLDPLPTSGVAQAPPDNAHDDRRFRDLIRGEGLKYYESTAVFFRPEVNAQHPELRPKNSRGEEMAPFDWYLGVSPHSRAYLAEREEHLESVTATLQPDGVFLSFIRFPGFWEGWTPAVPRETIEDYGFSDGSLDRFEADTGIELGTDRSAAVATLQNELHSDWVAWKVSVIVDVADRLRAAARRGHPGLEVLINGLPFAADERGDLGIDFLGQDLGALSSVAEHIETMVYHQIMARPASPWITDALDALRPVVGGTLLGSVQTSPTYTDGMHAGFGRADAWSPAEFEAALRALGQSRADGVSVYHWSDLVGDEVNGDGSMVRALRAYKDGVFG